MQLIREIEIAYFRSFYKSALYKCKDLNIIFGKNDAGKSNIIRALNLFFNNTSDQINDFDFNIDFCDSRSEEAEKSEDIRKFIYVKLTFNTPPSYKNSLGENFYVKRQWTVSRGDQFIEEFSSSIKQKHKHIATRFINKIRFIHIPAIKDISIFEKLLSDIYETLSNKTEFIDAVREFTNKIQNSTTGLFDNLPKEISSETKISVPSRLNSLFESLDFDTKIKKEDHSVSKSLTSQRGDGIKARHIPELLKFISDNDGYSYHLWGFEEPENSLDFVAAESEAQRFEKICQTDSVQIFTTTHSPSFYNLNSEYTNKYYVGYGEKGSTITQGKELDKIDAITAMSEGFYLPAVAESLKKYSDQQAIISKYRDELEKLSEEIQDLARPILLTEGRTDAIIMKEAWKRLFNVSCPFKIRECDTSPEGALGGAGGAT